MATFTEIVQKIGKTDKNTSHTYGQWYDYWFAPLQEKRVNVLEVGVCVFGGGCALSFAEYFYKGSVWAVDIDRSRCVSEVFAHPRISFIEADAYNKDWLKHISGLKFDIIIDDASHEVADQFKLLGMLKPYLANDGFYVIEDCCTCHWIPKLKDVWDMGLRHTIIDMATPTVYDNTLIRFEVRE